MPGASQQTKGQQEGFYAATIRHHDGEFWVVCEYLGLPDGMLGTVFKTSDPFDAAGWGDPYTFPTPNGDLDLFWDDDGQMYIPGGGHVLLDVDLEAGTVVNNTFLWAGTGDLFQDSDGNWWGVALTTRSGPEWRIYPMGRETVMFPVTWREGEWPILEPVRGKMSGWPMPATSRDLPGDGPFNSDPDSYDFTTLSSIPRNLIHWRVPTEGTFSIDASPQTDSLFTFQAVIDAPLTYVDQETGVTFCLTQFNHADVAIVILPKTDVSGGNARMLRLRATGEDAPAENLVNVPEAWGDDPIRFRIAKVNSTHYMMAASQASQPDQQVVMSTFSARLVSGQSGPFKGLLVGTYATCNGAGSGVNSPSGGDVWVMEWLYEGKGQYYTATDQVPE
ncbi:hypothetical protein CSAL01_04668 [Colletotrichum salicis]|uniref:Beta-xylosidase C-terminal Concanavalin A-like domain-containing protein n=1 Tax=Colletotrichum salicis TaxID=1209931 RepID=A0A135UW19_9PEZI|nr:hypothetical protein CSAL01_04668 [Colletotrichum salicis]